MSAKPDADPPAPATTAGAPEEEEVAPGDVPNAPGTLSFIPLEANPELMSGLLHRLGLSAALAVHDVYSLREPELLALTPRPALALLLVFPISAAYESLRLAEDATLPEYAGRGDAEPVVWFRQTIRNACGLIGLLHAVANGPARGFIEADSPLDTLLKQAVPLNPQERARLLETSQALAQAHQQAASQGATAAPDARDSVDLHYVCFVRAEDGALWELDGRRRGPLRRGHLDAGEDVLSERALVLGPLRLLDSGGGDLRFGCVALAAATD